MQTSLMQPRSSDYRLWVSRDAALGLLAHLSSPPIQERVGVFIGTAGTALSAIRLANSTNGPGAFRLEASELARASRYAARYGQEVLALYHDHSSRDLRLSVVDRLSLMRGCWPWLLVALDEGGLHARCYAPITCEPLEVGFELDLGVVRAGSVFRAKGE
jgi:proteasome lid subunit RPN8/RPN11